MITCNVCNLTKDFSAFYKSPRTKTGYQLRCKECAATTYHKPHYRENQQSYKDNARLNWLTNREAINAYKTEQGCVRCSESRYWCLAFHHTDSNKENTIAYMKYYALKTIMDEISKCIVVCHNCHADIHHNERMAGQ